MSNWEELTQLLATPRMQWYLQHGALARKAARHCRDAGSYLFGVLTFRQGLSGRYEERDGVLKVTVKNFFEPDEVTPPLLELVAAVQDDAVQPAEVEENASIQAILSSAQAVLDALDRALYPGVELRMVRDVNQASPLLHTCWRFSQTVEDFCASCEADLTALLRVQ